jgi:GNAT superfamily N-acetyltransferase
VAALSSNPLRDGDVEVKRMFVVPAHRGHGYARAVLAELERSAAAAGRCRVVLETGTRQPEAIALYRSCGYTPMAAFGMYRDSPSCRCLAKIVSDSR